MKRRELWIYRILFPICKKQHDSVNSKEQISVVCTATWLLLLVMSGKFPVSLSLIRHYSIYSSAAGNLDGFLVFIMLKANFMHNTRSYFIICFFGIHICWKLSKEASIKPPIQTEFFLSFGAITLAFTVLGEKHYQFCSQSFGNAFKHCVASTENNVFSQLISDL